MGRIVAPYGLKGWVKVAPYGADPETLNAHPVWWVGRNGDWRELKLAESARPHGASVMARFEGCVERDAALALKGCDIALAREELPPSADNEFYWVDLVGLKVVNVRGQELGAVAELFDNGAHPVMRVVAGDSERLLPFVEQVVRQVDMAESRICVEWELDW